MASLQTTLQQIATIISFKSDTNVLLDDIKSQRIDWDNIVKVSSQHLVLPTVYCRLEQKSLLDEIPEDLKKYLHEITTINANRNKTLLNEVQYISSLFNENNINHVFLKGIAFLAANYYENFGERMIGDIDVLVANRDIEKAYKLLTTKNYRPINNSLSDKYLKKRHLPRLVNEQKFGAVEIHSNLLKKSHFKILNPEKILASKIFINNVAIPKPEDLFEHNVLNFQINDNGNYYNNLNLRSTYDSILLVNKFSEINLIDLNHSTYFKNYFQLVSIFFKDVPINNKGFENKFYIFKITHPKFKKNWNKLSSNLLYFTTILNRISLFFSNEHYRKDILKSRKEVIKKLKKTTN